MLSGRSCHSALFSSYLVIPLCLKALADDMKKKTIEEESDLTVLLKDSEERGKPLGYFDYLVD